MARAGFENLERRERGDPVGWLCNVYIKKGDNQACVEAVDLCWFVNGAVLGMDGG